VIEKTFPNKDALAEASRCYLCGYCNEGCSICAEECPRGVITMEEEKNAVFLTRTSDNEYAK
jgi:Pyruvate/2-oxoacid:ferredoxin oxidoreductase delta subunit